MTDPLIYGAPRLGFTKAHLEYALDVEEAALRLIAVTPPGDHGLVAEEVARRTELMGPLPAYGSVYDDVVSGRWPR